MRQDLISEIAQVCFELFERKVDVELERTEEQFGDYSTNSALKLAGQLQKPPREIADLLASRLYSVMNDIVSEISVAGPGFINLRLKDETLVDMATALPTQTYKDQEVIVESGDPNPFKELHIGHLYDAIVGDTIGRLFDISGADVKSVSYHGDIGMHIAKAIWAIKQHLDKDPSIDIRSLLNSDTSIGGFYAEGARAFEYSNEAQEEVKVINKSIYLKDNSQINEIYEAGRTLSFEKFDVVFNELGIKTGRRYLESESMGIGLKLVQEYTGTVFEKSDGAVVYGGEKVGLHTRVFINSQGLPTYEAKDLGLAMLKDKDYPNASKSLIITDNQQADYFRVMLAALSEIKPELAGKTQHLFHGHLGLSSGKMSSRTGNVFAGSTLVKDIKTAINDQFPSSKVNEEIFLAALRYTFLRARVGSDIIFDVKESIALEGNSGPYIQYAHARARSIIDKSSLTANDLTSLDLDTDERRLLRKISEYSEVVDKAVSDLMPSYTCTYLYELAQVFNNFYEHNRVVGSDKEATRLNLVKVYADVLKSGLKLLGVPAPDKM